MHWIYLIHEFHNLSWITEINELFHDILIYWDAPVFFKGTVYIYFTRVYSKTDNWNCFCVLKWPRVQNKSSALYLKQSTSFRVPHQWPVSFPFYCIDCESRMPNILHATEKPHYTFKCLWHCRTAACAMLYKIHLFPLHWWVHSWVWVIPFQIWNICSFISASHIERRQWVFYCAGSLDDRTLFVLKLEHGRNYCTDKRIIHLYLKAFQWE